MLVSLGVLALFSSFSRTRRAHLSDREDTEVIHVTYLITSALKLIFSINLDQISQESPGFLEILDLMIFLCYGAASNIFVPRLQFV